MEVKVAVYEVRCMTNLHIGDSSDGYGIINNEVAKDTVMGTPIMPGSGIKGALREFLQQEQFPEKEEKEIFGNRNTEEEMKAGKYKFITGQLIFRPMRVSEGNVAYCLVTTKALIRLMMQTLKGLNIVEYRGFSIEKEDIEKELNGIWEEVKDKAGVVFFKGDQRVDEVEGYQLIKGEKADGIIEMLMKISEGHPIAVMGEDYFKTIDLPIIARNALEDGKSQNLWYEEVVPHQTIFYFEVVYEDYNNGKESAFDEFNKGITQKPIFFGGGNSIGNGYCKLTNI